MPSQPASRTRTEHLASWAANLQFADIPQDVVQKTKDFFLDWLGCTIAGRHHPAVSAMAKFAAQMGPSAGKSELVDGSLKFSTSPAFASLVNGASSHVVEQDDLHNRSIMHPVSGNATKHSIIASAGIVIDPNYVRQPLYTPLLLLLRRKLMLLARNSLRPALSATRLDVE